MEEVSSDLFRPPRVFAGEGPKTATLEEAKVVVLPVPYDGTMEYRGGAREGPQAIIDASYYLELYDVELGREISDVGIHTLPEVQPLMSGPEAMVQRMHQIAAGLVRKDKLVAMLGGEHSLTVGMVRAYRERYSGLSVLSLDAHTDLRDEYQGTRFSHACTMRRVWELCPVVHAGVRSLSREEHAFMSERSIYPFYAEDLAGSDSLDRLVSGLSDHVYVSVDLDVLDPSIMPAVGTPEPGGLSWHQCLGLLRAVTGTKRIVGFDLVELCPREGPNSCAFLAAKLAYKLMGYATTM